MSINRLHSDEIYEDLPEEYKNLSYELKEGEDLHFKIQSEYQEIVHKFFGLINSRNISMVNKLIDNVFLVHKEVSDESLIEELKRRYDEMFGSDDYNLIFSTVL